MNTTAIASVQPAFAVLWKDLERWAIPHERNSRVAAPEGWISARVGELVKQVTTRVPVEADIDYKMAGVKWYGEGVFHRETVRGDQLSARYVTPLVPRALIYNRLFAWKESFAVVPAELDGCFVSNEFPQFIPDETRVLADFLYLFCICKSTIRKVNAGSTGSAAVSRNRFKEEQFLNLEVALPSLTEQRAIVSRLRKAKAEISLRLKRSDEDRRALEARFLTDVGLTTTRAMPTRKAFAVLWKDVERWGVQMVGISALGRTASVFPEVRLAELCSIGSGGTPSRQRPDFFGGGIPWVKTTEVQNGLIVSTEETLSEDGLKNSSARVYPKGSLLIAMYGQGATRGRTAKLGIAAATNQACAVLFNISAKVETDFLWYFLMSQYDAMRALASGNNQPNLNAEMISNLRISVPPLAVQREIVRRMAAGLAKIEKSREAIAILNIGIGQETENAVLGAKPLGRA